MDKIIIRSEQKSDIATIYQINELAFKQPQEGRLVDTLRKKGVETISLVASLDNMLVGHCLFTPVTVEEGSHVVESIALGPVAVLPDYQGQGIGAKLIRAGLEKCRQAGYEAVFVLGHRAYYPRFGFQPTQQFDIRCEFDVPPDLFMAVELQPDALATVQGVVTYHPEFKNV